MRISTRHLRNERSIHPVYRPDIDGLRAVAILMVITFHAFPLTLRGGFVGVDIFFVISGYLISNIIFSGIKQGHFSLAHFYANRIRRIFPALIVVLAAGYAFGWNVLLPHELKQLGKHIAAGAGFVENLILWQEIGYFDTAAELKPLLHLWSLAVEEQFYLLFPMLIFAAWRLGLNVLSTIVLVSLTSFLLNISGVAKAPSDTFFMPQTRVWELLAGSILANLQSTEPAVRYAWLKRNMYPHLLSRHFPLSVLPRSVLNNISSSLGLLLIVFAAFIISKNRPFPGWWALLPVAGASLLILAGPEASVNRVVLANRWMVFIGLISYPLYLWHYPILSFIRIMDTDAPNGGIRAAALILSFLLAWLTYLLIEKPIRLRSNTWITPAILSLVLAAIGCIGASTFQTTDLASHIPIEIRHIVDFKYEYLEDARAGRCWLSAKQAPEGFGSECIELPKSEENQSVLIWGDSHAARLYPGLRATLNEHTAISQLTRDSCPPLMGFGYDICKESNAHVMTNIEKNLPNMVIMFAVWSHYQKDGRFESAAREGLLESIRRLKQLGVKSIILLGPAPSWKDNLPKLVYKAWRASSPHIIPERLAVGFNLEVSEVDIELEDIVRSVPFSSVPFRFATCLYSNLCVMSLGALLIVLESRMDYSPGIMAI